MKWAPKFDFEFWKLYALCFWKVVPDRQLVRDKATYKGGVNLNILHK